MRRSIRHLLLVLTLRCEDADEIRLRQHYGESDRVEALAERLHRMICGTCRRSKPQTEVLDEAMDQFAQIEASDR
ncbi:MAG: hypothetical protein AAGD32_08580 [Planctomycetota bacterium]